LSFGNYFARLNVENINSYEVEELATVAIERAPGIDSLKVPTSSPRVVDRNQLRRKIQHRIIVQAHGIAHLYVPEAIVQEGSRKVSIPPATTAEIGVLMEPLGP
jgi:hypothetical protein